MAKKKSKRPVGKPKSATPQDAQAKARFLALKEKFFGSKKDAKTPATKSTAAKSAATKKAAAKSASADAVVQAELPGVRIVKKRGRRTSDAAAVHPMGAVPLSELKRKYTNDRVPENTDDAPPLTSTVVHFNYAAPTTQADSAVDIGEKVAVVRDGKTRMIQG